MIIKAILFDVDGVLLQVPYFFTQELQNRGYTEAAQIMTDYYKNDNTLCVEWKADAKNLIEPYLVKIWWNKWVKEYFKEQFKFEGQYIETALRDLIPRLQEWGIKCYLWTDQENNRAKFLLEWLNFENMFDGYFISCYIWERKSSPEFWNYVSKILREKDIQKEEIVFFDDLQGNVDRAQQSWIQSFLFTDIKTFKKDLKMLGIKI